MECWNIEVGESVCQMMKRSRNRFCIKPTILHIRCIQTMKMYRYFKKHFWWPGMKRYVVKYVARCLICQQVKAEHQRPGGLLQLLKILEWKWDEVRMEFVTRLPRSSERYNSIWVIHDWMTKSAHFLPMRITDLMKMLAKLYVNEIVHLHGVLVLKMSDQDTRFTSAFWRVLQEGLAKWTNYTNPWGYAESLSAKFS